MAEIQSPVTGSTRFDDDDDTGFPKPDSAELRREIDRTRANMDETFNALESKLTPGQLLEEVWHLFKGGSSAGASKLWQVAKEHPMPAAVIGLGIGWLLMDSSKGSSRSQRQFRSDYDYRGYGYGESFARTGSYGSGAYGSESFYGSENRFSGAYGSESEEHEGRLSSAAHKAKDTVDNVADSAKDMVSGARERVGDLTDRARSKASHLSEEARFKARQTRTGFWNLLEEQPMAVGAATLALGVIAGLAIPSTRKEDELMGETRDRLFDEVKEAGQDALEKGKQVASAAVETVKSEVQNQDLTASGIADKVRSVAKEAKNAVKEEAKKQNLTPENLTEGQGQGQDQQQGTGEKGGRGRKAQTTPTTTPTSTAATTPTTPPVGQTTTGPTAGGMPGTMVTGQTDKIGKTDDNTAKNEQMEPELAKR